MGDYPYRVEGRAKSEQIGGELSVAWFRLSFIVSLVLIAFWHEKSIRMQSMARIYFWQVLATIEARANLACPFMGASAAPVQDGFVDERCLPSQY
jgi:hypothetical protein